MGMVQVCVHYCLLINLIVGKDKSKTSLASIFYGTAFYR